jgi:hypothetical protein
MSRIPKRQATPRLAALIMILPTLASFCGCQSTERVRSTTTGHVPVSPKSLSVDHVTIAGTDLAQLQDAFAAIGLEAEYGGAHSNGVTHMALLGFDDGSYLELISTVSADQSDIPIWKNHIVSDGGPCGWAARSDDVAAELKRLATAGLAVQGPFPGSRQRPDGEPAAWNLGFVGDQAPGAVLPFMIEDTTPRQNRVQPSPSVAGTELQGVALVVIGVSDLSASISLYRRAYDWPAPWIREDQEFGATLAHFLGTPVVLAAPSRPHNWLAKRLDRLGESPCAYLIATGDFPATARRFGLNWTTPWFGRLVAWFNPADLRGTHLGLIE